MFKNYEKNNSWSNFCLDTTAQYTALFYYKKRAVFNRDKVARWSNSHCADIKASTLTEGKTIEAFR